MTGIQFERVPASGALEYLKGDLYVPHAVNYYCIEVKFYKESPFCDKIFTQERTNNLARWWNKVVLQAEQGTQAPLLFFKYNRSKIYVCTDTKPDNTRYVYIDWLNCYLMLAEEWLKNEKVEFISSM